MPSKSTPLACTNQSIIHYCLFLKNNTSMYEKHISWKQWYSLKIYSRFHKPNKPVPARARKKKAGWQCKLIKKYWKGYPRYLHTYTSQGLEVFFRTVQKLFPMCLKKSLTDQHFNSARQETNQPSIHMLGLTPSAPHLQFLFLLIGLLVPAPRGLSPRHVGTHFQSPEWDTWDKAHTVQEVHKGQEKQ